MNLQEDGQTEEKTAILIVDDNEINRMILSETFRDQDKILEAENGKEALDLIRREPGGISAILLDIVMPEMDGLELLVQANQKFKGLKIVIFSAFADFSYAKTALENRGLHYFLKPIDPDEFQNILSEIVETVTREQEDSRRLQRPGAGTEDVIGAFLHKEGSPPLWLKEMLDGRETFRLQL